MSVMSASESDDGAIKQEIVGMSRATIPIVADEGLQTNEYRGGGVGVGGLAWPTLGMPAA